MPHGVLTISLGLDELQSTCAFHLVATLSRLHCMHLAVYRSRLHEI